MKRSDLTIKISALTENTSCRPDILCEHGLSLYIETKDHRILFDMGQTDMFGSNAHKLDIDLASVDIAVLSHGHYDHGGGLARFLETNKSAPVYITNTAFEPHYNGTEKYIGLDTSLLNHPRLVYTSGITAIGEGLTLYGAEIVTPTLGAVSGLTKKQGDRFVTDDFLHEQYLLIEEHGMRVLFSGCSHRGILGIARHFRPDVLIGGFHFSKLPMDDNMENAAKELEGLGCVYYTCHCTGTDRYEFMKNNMTKLNYISAGMTVEI